MATSYGCGGCGVSAKHSMPMPADVGPAVGAMPVNRVREPAVATVVRQTAPAGGCSCQGERRTMWLVIAAVAVVVLWRSA